ncbi:glycosyltransferase family 1 protein [Lentibacillus sp. N15]|uniref:glycosyltransferase family 1 protein n=1 Tax=Lentibacillus songyuanensis TaxID=3136161 RepID=UPI0031BB0A3A
MKPVKILHVVGAMNRAGTETMLMNIYRDIDRTKIQFDFISYSDQEADYDQEIERLGGRVIRLGKTTSIKQIYQAIKMYGPYHAIHAHTLFHCGIASIAARLAGVKIRIAHAHTTLDKSDRLLRKLYIRFMRRLIKRFSTHLLACSAGAGRYLFGKSALTKSTYTYFPNVIDFESFLDVSKTAIGKFKLETGLGKHLIIGHAGRFIEAKNHAFLVEVTKFLQEKDPAVKVLFAGDGDLKDQMVAEVKKAGLGDTIHFLGKRNDISTVLHSMDVFVFPSLYEGLGLVLLEAQASGIPCVVSEAIQPEADIGLGLMKALPLAVGPSAWADNIISLAANKGRSQHDIITAFEQKRYSIIQGIATLMEIYQLKAGGVYERNTGRLF